MGAKVDGAECYCCNWRGPVNGLESRMEAESWEMPTEYEVHTCPKCGEDIQGYYDLGALDKANEIIKAQVIKIARLETKLAAEIEKQ